jgi:multidrug efflux pump subunit AcrA (membrane-fusion protein)
MKKWIIIIITVLIIGFAGYQWYSHNTSTQQATTQTRTASVQKGKLEVKVSGSGIVQPVTSEDIKSTIDNNAIDAVLVSAGETVTKGESLITFTDGSDPITAPADGMITSISVSAGQRVTIGQAVAHITNYSDLQTVVKVDELDVPKVKTGQTASITVSAYSDKTFTGTVTAVSNEGSTSNGVSTFDVTVHIDKPDNLKVGMSTEASILTDSKENALYVPVDAVHTANNEKYVIVMSAGSGDQTSTSQQVTVKTGLSNDENVEITEGVTEGQTVQLPQLTTSTSTSNNKQGGMMQGMGSMGGMPPSGGGASGGRSGN